MKTSKEWDSDNRYDYDYDDYMPPNYVYRWAGMKPETGETLANKNDYGATFKEIADYIEKRL